MRGDFFDSAMEYRDVDRAAQRRAEEEMMEREPLWRLDGDEAIKHVHPDDRARVLEVHAQLPGQTLGTTCANLLRAGFVRWAEGRI